MSSQKKALILLTWIDDSKDPKGYEKLELPIKTADLLLKQWEKSSKPKYIPVEDLVRYGYEAKSQTQANPLVSEQTSPKPNKNKKEIVKANPVHPTTLKTKEEFEKEKKEAEH